jgi:DNA-binding CsgD family transcriptional regulator
LRAYALAKIAGNTAPTCVERIPEAEAWALEALSAAPRAGRDVERLALYALGWARSLRGRPIDDICERFRAADAGFDLTDSPEPVANQRLTWRGDVTGARAAFSRLLSLADERGEAMSYALQRLHLCELELRAGEWAAAARLLDEWSESSDLLVPWGLVTAKRCGALIRLASATYDENAAGQLVDAAAAYGELGLRFDRARSLLSLGRAQRRLKKWGAARRSLEQAAAAFDEIGSPGWADETRAELARVGARRPQPTGALTPAERRVAELAAGGSSNKEIARILFVTVHTVEVHLSHAYAKLGVRSRAQLARRLSAAS